MKKSIYLFSLILAIIFYSNIGISAFAEEGEFNIRSDGVLLHYEGPGGDVVIPDGVTDLAEGAFSHCDRLRSVVIPEGVTQIRQSVFNHCENLVNVSLPSSLTTIKSDAFAYCINLQDITIPANVTTIEGGAFEETPWLKNMGEFAVANGILLKYCGSSPYVGVPSGITSIADKAFCNNKTLCEVIIPHGVTYIGDLAFQQCENLTSVTIPNSVVKIGRHAFQWCTGLTDIAIPDSVTELGFNAFYECKSLKTAVLSKNLRMIQADTFAYCPSLSNIVIPEGVVYIGGGSSGAFGCCTGLTEIKIPDSVSEIGKAAFSGCTGLTNIVIPDSVTQLGQGIFDGCTNLTNVVIPDTITEIPGVAFRDCAKLDNVIIPANVTSIGSGAFSGCSSLKNLIMPEGLTNVGDGAFSGTPWIEGQQSQQGDFLIVGGNLSLYRGTEEMVEIPKGVTKISDRAFKDNKNVKYITIPDGVTEIGYGAFQGCMNLTSVTIPTSVTLIGDRFGNTNIFYYLDGDDVYGKRERVLPNLTLHVSEGSYAESWAKKLNIPYVSDVVGPSAPAIFLAETGFITAIPNRSKVQVDGRVIAFDAYTINQNNYFKLRDLAMALNGTGRQFEVTWDGKNNAINLISDKSYTVVGGELVPGDGTEKTAVLNTSTIYLNGQPIQLTAYTINNNNYFKLRDVGQTFGFNVSWDGVRNTIVVNTSESYTAD